MRHYQATAAALPRGGFLPPKRAATEETIIGRAPTGPCGTIPEQPCAAVQARAAMEAGLDEADVTIVHRRSPLLAAKADPPRMVENLPPYVAANSMPGGKEFHWARPAVAEGPFLEGQPAMASAAMSQAMELGALADADIEEREHLLRSGSERGLLPAVATFCVLALTAAVVAIHSADRITPLLQSLWQSARAAVLG